MRFPGKAGKREEQKTWLETREWRKKGGRKGRNAALGGRIYGDAVGLKLRNQLQLRGHYGENGVAKPMLYMGWLLSQ